MNAGVTSLTAVMAKTDIGGEAYVAKYGESDYVELVAVYSIYVGITSAVMGLFGFAELTQKVPGAVKTGFKVSIFLTQYGLQFARLLYHLIHSLCQTKCSSGVVNLVFCHLPSPMVFMHLGLLSKTRLPSHYMVMQSKLFRLLSLVPLASKGWPTLRMH